MARIAVIPARGGSKRIPGKNIKLLYGQPIISYVIKAVKSTNLFDEIMISTDSQEIAEIAKKNGAKVPFLRSTDNSDDFATLSDVLLEVLREYKGVGISFDEICCILPTAALVTPEKIMEGHNQLKKGICSSIVPVIRFAYPIQRALKETDGLLEMREMEYLSTRSQDLENFYHDSGQFYWLNTVQFLEEKKIFMERTGYIELNEYEAQDVDNMVDWTMLELKYKLKK